MKYLVLVKVKKDEVENYLQTWDQQIPELQVIQGPYMLYQRIEDAHSIILLETKKFSKAEEFCEGLQSTKSVKITPILDDEKALEELVKFKDGKRRAETDYKNTKVTKLDIGDTRRLEVLPLIDWRTSDSELKTETGVSYLVKTDETTILFDLALNPREEHPSPLLINMERLGVSLDDVDSIFITHKHGDHIGGGKWYDDDTFSLSAEQTSLGQTKVYTPVEMTYPGITPIHSPDPFILGKGVASLGTIPNSMFSFGYTQEMGLAVHVAGKGIVLIIGCGHQGLFRILERYNQLFDEPLYGIIGGLHYPVLGGPIEMFGYFSHQHIGTGKLPWEPITVEELMVYVELLRNYNPKLLALSAHDSSEFSINTFREAFPEAFKEILVGTSIKVE